MAKAGRTREYVRGVHLPVPADFEIPTCDRCGDEFMSPEISEQLDQTMKGLLCARFAESVQIIVGRHGVSQLQVEDAARVTRSYFSHVCAGRKEPSGTLALLLEIFERFPATFQYASSGRGEPPVRLDHWFHGAAASLKNAEYTSQTQGKSKQSPRSQSGTYVRTDDRVSSPPATHLDATG